MATNGFRKKAKQHLGKARQRIKELSPSSRKQDEERLISAVRSTREKLWEAKVASRS